MEHDAARDNRTLIDFWDRALAPDETASGQESPDPEEDWKTLAPSEKLFLAASALGQRKKVLDYGCGSAWAAIIAAKSGCPDVAAADPAPGAVRAAAYYADLFHTGHSLRAECIPDGWLSTLPPDTYDGLICSNVLDVIPAETAAEILRETARIVTADADVIIGLNYYLSPEAAVERGMELADGRALYIDGVLRLFSRTDEEWTEVFSPYFTVEQLEHFAWPGEAAERRRLFRLKKKS